MPIGILCNVFAVVAGGLLGSALGEKLPERLKEEMTCAFGVCAMAMGVSSVVLMRNMPAVIFSVILGTLAGSAININAAIRRASARTLGALHLSVPDPDLMVTAIALFCFSGTGIYGSLTSGMTGDHSVLIAKSVLDFFTAMIFACRLRRATALIGPFQLVVMLALFFSAKLIVPMTNEAMIADFKACGGVILLATGLTIMKIRAIPIANMIPALVIVMPVSALWTAHILPVL